MEARMAEEFIVQKLDVLNLHFWCTRCKPVDVVANLPRLII